METIQYALRKLAYSLPLLLGVTFLSFVLMVYFGPDQTYTLLGKNPTSEQIAEAVILALQWDLKRQGSQ